MYRFCLVMFILSTTGAIANIVLIIRNTSDTHAYLHAISLGVFSVIFLTLMRYYKNKGRRKKQ